MHCTYLYYIDILCSKTVSPTFVAEVDAEKLGASRTPHGRSFVGPSRTRARRGMRNTTWGWDMEDTRNTETPWVVPPPRMPVANEGL